MAPYHNQFPVKISLPDRSMFRRRIDAIECLSNIDKSSVKTRAKPRPLPRRPRHQRLWSNPLNAVSKMDNRPRPLFGQWLKQVWLDLLTFGILGAVGLTLYLIPPLQPRLFPLLDVDGAEIWPHIAYPITKEQLPIWLVVVLVTTIPVTVILLCQIRIRSFWDANNAITGLLYSLASAAVFQVFLKWLIGGLRPQFLAICNPDPYVTRIEGVGFNQVMHSKTVCRTRGKNLDKAFDAFPSGHATAAFAALVFLSLYLNAKFKVFSNYQPRLWKLLLISTPILGATLISAQMVADYTHHWSDVCAGAVIGIVAALSSFRMMYASIWDFRTNHIVLLQNVASDDVHQLLGPKHITQAICTRKPGWAPNAEVSEPQKTPETPATTKEGLEKTPPESKNGSSGAVGQVTGPSSAGVPLTRPSTGGGQRQKVEETV